MAIGITVITTTNQVRRFFQTDATAFEQIFSSLQRSAQLFSGTPLIIGSAGQT